MNYELILRREVQNGPGLSRRLPVFLAIAALTRVTLYGSLRLKALVLILQFRLPTDG